MLARDRKGKEGEVRIRNKNESDTRATGITLLSTEGVYNGRTASIQAASTADVC